MFARMPRGVERRMGGYARKTACRSPRYRDSLSRRPTMSFSAVLAAGDAQDPVARSTMCVISAGVSRRIGGPEWPVPLLT